MARAFDADDLTQEVFLKLLTSAASCKLSHERDPLPYVLAVAKNLFIDVTRRIPASESESSASSSELYAEGWVPECVEKAHQQARLRDYVASLSPVHYQVYLARYTVCLSQREAAIALGMTRRQIRSFERQILDGARRWCDRPSKTEPVAPLGRKRSSAPRHGAKSLLPACTQSGHGTRAMNAR